MGAARGGRSIAAAALVAAVLIGWPAGAADAPRRIDFRTRTMGTTATLSLVTADSAAVADLAYRALLSLHHTDSLMTNWTDTSETARINRLAGRETVRLDPEVAQVLAVAARVGRESGGAFDLTVEPLVRLWGFLAGQPAVPDSAAIAAARRRVGWEHLDLDAAAGTLRFTTPDARIDLGGVAKGYGVDRVAGLLRQAGVRDALIDLSGNMVALGHAPGRNDGWVLGVLDPEGSGEHLATVGLGDGAIATSGNYLQYVMADMGGRPRRYGHILDPRTGWPAQGVASATVIAPDATTADAWATALVVLPPDEARAVARAHPELQVILVAHPADGVQVIWVEEDLRPRVDLNPRAAARCELRSF
ncbi:FAD:protein FMN transferase [bacterium]|nr:FAD:protein FMN transferase [bacterium]